MRGRWPSKLAPCFLAPLLAGAVYGAVPEVRIEPTTLYFGAATSPAVAAGRATIAAPVSRREIPQELREKAERRGVRVLVQLAMAFTPEGRLSGLQAAGQREMISQVQETTLRKLEGLRAKLHARYTHIPFMALEVDAAALERLSLLPEVAGVQEDELLRPQLASSTAVIGAGVAWANGLTGAGKAIAVLDSGVDKTHPFFSSGDHNKVVSEACYSSTTNSTTSLCPGGVAESTAPGSGVNCPLTTSISCRHGTHVAGIAAGNDGIGPRFGVARDADIISIQVFSWDSFGLGAWWSDIIKGLERVFALVGDLDIAAVNMSLGGWPYSSQASCDADNAAVKAAIDNLRSIDIATVAASGNSFAFGVSAPACISSAVSVGATDDDDNVAAFSNIAPFLSLLAPGVFVESSVPGGGTASIDGTSMASPHVAGAWAVLRQASPSATVSDLLALLRGTAVSVSERGVQDMRRIDLGRAAVTGPSVSHEFMIHNDGTSVLSVLSMQLETLVPWVRWSPEAPFDVAPGSSRAVSVAVNFGEAPEGASSNRLIVTSTDADESPYPDAVHLILDKQQCYLLSRKRTGQGGFPVASPSTSPGCPAGQFYAGTVVQLTAAPSTGWVFESWSGTDDDASTAPTNTLTMPEAAHTVSVTYNAPCFALTRSHTGSGSDPAAAPASSPGCSAGQYKYGQIIQLTANPNRGWRIGGWTNTSNDASTTATNSLMMPGNAQSVSVTYIEGLPSVLLVDDYSFFPFRSLYTEALNSLGRIYDIWDTTVAGSPPATALSAYPRVVWIAGFGGPSSSEEASLKTYLDGGGSLFLSGPDYIFSRGLTSFISDYLGVGTVNQDFFYFQVSGQGSSFGGLGPYTLDFAGFDDLLWPAAGAETAFVTDAGSAAVSKIGTNGSRTLFLGFPFEALPTPEARREVLDAGLDFLGTVFADVPKGYWAKKWIEAAYRNGVTSGCGTNPRVYCPEGGVTRGGMAVFLLLAKEGPGYSPPPCTTAPFNDVPASSPLCPWIQELALRGVTSGCGNGNYCPESLVSRAQMAVFLLATFEGQGYAPPPCTTAPFNDVPVSTPFCPWIQELAKRGITGGCGGGAFCPGGLVNRAQMAVFLVTNFRLPIY